MSLSAEHSWQNHCSWMDHQLQLVNNLFTLIFFQRKLKIVCFHKRKKITDILLKGFFSLWLLENTEAELHKNSSGNFLQFCNGLEEVRDEQLVHCLSYLVF